MPPDHWAWVFHDDPTLRPLGRAEARGLLLAPIDPQQDFPWLLEPAGATGRPALYWPTEHGGIYVTAPLRRPRRKPRRRPRQQPLRTHGGAELFEPPRPRKTRPLPKARSMGLACLTAAEKAEARRARRRLPVLQRPRTRGECEGVPRPCPWVSCRFHLYLDRTAGGAPKLNFPSLEPWELAESCALDVADRGGVTLEEVGALINVTMERARQIEEDAKQQVQIEVRKLRRGDRSE